MDIFKNLVILFNSNNLYDASKMLSKGILLPVALIAANMPAFLNYKLQGHFWAGIVA